MDAKPWHIGPKLIALSEYYLKTGDPDVLPSIRAYAHCIANGQSMFGTCGHYFTDPGFRNNPVNGPYNIGYGPINNAAIPCYIGLILANKCGLTDPEILAGIERAGTFYAQYTHLGCAGYGEHGPYMGHDTNGKAGLQALAFQFEGDRPVETKYYAKSSTAAAIAERDIGHTGSFFAFLYAPLGANVGGPDAMAYYFRETRWMYELARRWDGSFVYNSFSSGGVEVDSLVGQGGCLMATPMLLTYAMPLRQTYMTGKNQNPANWITPAEMPEVSAASAHIYNHASRTTAELLQEITSWSPKQRLAPPGNSRSARRNTPPCCPPCTPWPPTKRPASMPAPVLVRPSVKSATPVRCRCCCLSSRTRISWCASTRPAPSRSMPGATLKPHVDRPHAGMHRQRETAAAARSAGSDANGQWQPLRCLVRSARRALHP